MATYYNSETYTCSNCGRLVKGMICPVCRAKRDEMIDTTDATVEETQPIVETASILKKCPNCGTECTSKYCPECGKEIPKLCANCGATVVGKFCAECGTPYNEDNLVQTVPAVSVPFRATKSCCGLEIDEKAEKWRVKNSKSTLTEAKKHGMGNTLAKGGLAVLTGGLSIAVELGAKALANAPISTPYTYDQLISFTLLEDDETVTSGGMGQALVGGAVFGGLGAIAGGVTAKRKTKKVINTIAVKLTVDDIKNPCIIITLLNTPTKIKDPAYKNAYNSAQNLLSMLDLITHRANK